MSAGTKKSGIKRRPVCALAAALLLHACAVGPDYQAPDIAVPGQFAAREQDQAGDPESLADWWAVFHDPLLNELVVRALENNREVSAALARVNQARALSRQAFAELFPRIDGRASYESAQISGAQFPGGSDEGFSFELWQLGLDAAWELDIFGGVRRSAEARRAVSAAAEASLADVLRITAAEVAATYFQLRGSQSQLAVAEKSIAAEEETLRLVEARESAGAVSELDRVQALAQLRATRSLVPEIAAAERTAMHRLAVLVGAAPGELTSRLSSPQAVPLYRGPDKLGAPALLLRRRPDLRAAERRLAASTALIGAATAGLYPQMSFLGSLSIEAPYPEKWFDGNAATYAIGPSIRVPLLNFGRVRASIDAADAAAQEALAAYESAVLQALEEVENALTAFAKQRQRRAELIGAVQASERAYELSRVRYREGAVDLLRVLEAQRALLINRASLTRAETEIGLALVAMYKALGGGWEGYQLAAAEQKPAPGK